MRERLKGKVNDDVIKYLFSPSIQDELLHIFPYMMKVNKAHMVMLGEQGIVQKNDVKQILAALVEMEKNGLEKLNIDPSIEDLHYNVEQNLISNIGIKIAGKMHTARSRNDLAASTSKMAMRKAVLNILDLIMDIRSLFIEIAKQHTNTIMPAYTHFQAAQPITLAHYLSACCSAFERDFQRLFYAFKNLNHSPLGAGAIAGTGFNIDRELPARLLGFDGVAENTVDAIATKDYILEILSSLSIFMTTLSRISQDFYTWSTFEFNLVEIEDSVAATSSIMPQKKNPITFEHIKGKAAHVYGALMSSLAVLKNTPLTHTRDVARESLHYFFDALFEVEAAVSLAKATFRNIRIKPNSMLQKVENSFSCTTDLADFLVVKEEISFREAHQIVGKMVLVILDQNQGPKAITETLLARISEEVIGREILLSDDTLKQVLDPVYVVEKRTHTGGPSPTEVERMLSNSEVHLQNDRKKGEGIIRSLEEAENELNSFTLKYLELD